MSTYGFANPIIDLDGFSLPTVIVTDENHGSMVGIWAEDDYRDHNLSNWKSTKLRFYECMPDPTHAPYGIIAIASMYPYEQVDPRREHILDSFATASTEALGLNISRQVKTAKNMSQTSLKPNFWAVCSESQQRMQAAELMFTQIQAKHDDAFGKYQLAQLADEKEGTEEAEMTQRMLEIYQNDVDTSLKVLDGLRSEYPLFEAAFYSAADPDRRFRDGHFSATGGWCGLPEDISNLDQTYIQAAYSSARAKFLDGEVTNTRIKKMLKGSTWSEEDRNYFINLQNESAAALEIAASTQRQLSVGQLTTDWDSFLASAQLSALSGGIYR